MSTKPIYEKWTEEQLERYAAYLVEDVTPHGAVTSLVDAVSQLDIAREAFREGDEGSAHEALAKARRLILSTLMNVGP